jgi:hypothetical protein
MTLRAQRLLDLVRELDVRAARREAHGFRSNMPLQQSPPFTVSDGRLKSFCQSVTRTTPARWPPDEWPDT